MRSFFVILLLFLAVLGLLITFSKHNTWVAIITILTAGTISYLEFSGTEKKLYKLNEILYDLELVLMWFCGLNKNMK